MCRAPASLLRLSDVWRWEGQQLEGRGLITAHESYTELDTKGQKTKRRTKRLQVRSCDRGVLSLWSTICKLFSRVLLLRKKSVFLNMWYPFCKDVKTFCEQTGVNEGRIVVNSFGKLLKTLAVMLAASSHRIRLEIYVCVLTTKNFCCLSDDWRVAKNEPAHSSPSQPQAMCTLFFCSFPARVNTTMFIAADFFTENFEIQQTEC